MSFLLGPQVYFTTSGPSAGRSCGSNSRWGGYPSSYSRCGGSRTDAGTLLFNLFDDTYREVERASKRARKPAAAPFNPRFDVKETNEAYVLSGEVPGVEQKDVEVEFLDESTLKIKGKTESSHEEGAPDASEKASETSTTTTEEPRAATPASEAGSTRTLQATVEDEVVPDTAENEWVDVDGPQKPLLAEEKGKQPAKEQQQQQQPQEQEKVEQAKRQSWLSERRHGEFSRSFRFASRVNRDAVTASLRNGVLQIVVPKAEAPAVRKISIE